MYESRSKPDNATGQTRSIDTTAATAAAPARLLEDPLAVAERLVRLLAHDHAGLVTDIDGTISPIAAVPSEAYVVASARAALAGLRRCLALVGVVTGRSVADARRLVQLDGLVYIGNHGYEVDTAQGPQLIPEALPWVPRIAAALDEMQRRVSLRGVVVENKRATASVHYRRTADPEAARRALLEALAESIMTSGLRLEEGRMVLNLLPPLAVNKGTAVSWLAHQRRLERLAYLGDDVTDTHAFTALGDLRERGLRTLSVGVIGPETPQVVRQLADACVPDVQAVADLLGAVLDGLQAGASMERTQLTEQRFGE